ncbi:MAG: molybdenum cofactor biosynthesis protein MoaE [Syntrophobacteria bacterium]
MDLQKMVSAIKALPDYDKVGMIACHNGVVRATSRDGRRVAGLEVHADRKALEEVLEQMRGRPGIIAVTAHIWEGYRQVGDDVMLVAVAGDIRDHVFPVLEETVDRLKKAASSKEEFFLDED